MTKSQIRLIITIIVAALCSIALIAALFGSSNILESFKSAFSPLISGVSIAFIINIPMQKIEDLISKKRALKDNSKNGNITAVALLLSWAITLILIFLICGIVLPHLITSITTVAEGISQAPQIIKELLIKIGIDAEKINFSSVFSKLGDLASGLIGELSAFLDGAFSFFTGAVLSIYILANKKMLKAQAKRVLFAYFPLKAKKICDIAQLTYSTFMQFLTGQLTEAVIVGLIYFLILSVFAFPYAQSISLVNAVLTLIPYIGPFIGCALGFLLLAISDTTKAFIFIAVFLIVQFIEGQLIYPRVVGRRVGLSAIWTLIAALIGSRIGGFFGALIFIPGFSVIYTIIRSDVNEKLKGKALY